LKPRSLPRIEMGSVRLERVPANEPSGGKSTVDGSPDDDVMQDDQDALAPSVFEQGRTGRGIHIRVPGVSPGGNTDYPDGIRWLQTIETNTALPGRGLVYTDFIPPSDDGKPFYFTDARENATFSDNPSRSTNNVQWDAVLSLVGVRGRTITRFDSVKYGFDIDASGTLNLHAPAAVGPGSLVVHSDTLRSGYSDWNFSGGFTVPDVPSGGTTGGSAIG
jgi:hypothetical protein